jgi:hypothetical protein
MDGSASTNPTVSVAVSLTFAAMALPSTGTACADSHDSELPGMTCTDNSTGHYFRVSRDNYELHWCTEVTT